jgi:Transcriptional regulator, AbiEi antitoxin
MLKVLRAMPDDVRGLLRTHNGLFRLAEARQAGITHGRVRRLLDAHLLTRVGDGTYVSTAGYRTLDAWELYQVRGRAFSASCPAAFLTGWSAVVMWRLPTVGSPPLLPVALRPRKGPGGSKVTPYGRIVLAHLPQHHRWRMGTTRLVSRAWAAVEVGRISPLPEALIVADAAKRTGADLAEAVQFMRRWEGVGQAEWVAKHANANAETALETLGRFICIEFALPMPVCNAWVGGGRPRFRVDGLWPFHWSVFEGDGAIKYDNRPDASRVIAAQNEREWHLRRRGLDFARYAWDLARWRRAELAGRFQALLRDNPPRSEPIQWWKDVPGVGPVEPEERCWPSPYPSPIVLPSSYRA